MAWRDSKERYSAQSTTIKTRSLGRSLGRVSSRLSKRFSIPSCMFRTRTAAAYAIGATFPQMWTRLTGPPMPGGVGSSILSFRSVPYWGLHLSVPQPSSRARIRTNTLHEWSLLVTCCLLGLAEQDCGHFKPRLLDCLIWPRRAERWQSLRFCPDLNPIVFIWFSSG